MGRRLQFIIGSLGAAAIAGSVYLALDLRGSPAPESGQAAAVSALPGTSNPRLGSEALPEPANHAVAPDEAASGAPEAGTDWESARALADESVWTATSETVAALSDRGAWSEDERDEVLDALQWRHQQMISFRGAIQQGDVGVREGREALVEVANKARATVIMAVGPERAKALDEALARSQVGAGL